MVNGMHRTYLGRVKGGFGALMVIYASVYMPPRQGGHYHTQPQIHKGETGTHQNPRTLAILFNNFHFQKPLRFQKAETHQNAL